MVIRGGGRPTRCIPMIPGTRGIPGILGGGMGAGTVLFTANVARKQNRHSDFRSKSTGNSAFA